MSIIMKLLCCAVFGLAAAVECVGQDLEWRSLRQFWRHGGDGPAVAWDESSQSTIIFGDGELQQPSGFGQQTFEYRDDGLHLLRPLSSPPARGGARMAFDPISKQLILFGGGIWNVDFNDTWAWDGQTWKQLFPQAAPSPRRYFAMGVDKSSGKILLFGGAATANGGIAATYSDTWEWTGANWVQLLPTTVPGRRLNASLAWDSSIGALCMYGGSANGWFGLYPGECWVWRSGNWQLGPKTPFVGVGAVLRSPKQVTHNVFLADDGVATNWWEGSVVHGWHISRDMGKRYLSPLAYYDNMRSRLVAAVQKGASLDFKEWDGKLWSHVPGFLFATPNSRGWHYSGKSDAIRGFDAATSGAGVMRVVELRGHNVAEAFRYDAVGDGTLYAYMDDVDMCLSIRFERYIGWRTWLWSPRAGFVRDNRKEIDPASPLVYDSGRKCVVMYGGNGVTWEWRQATGWQAVSTVHFPSRVTNVTAAYDIARKRVVAFETPARNQQTVWEYDGIDWRDVTPAVNPPWREGGELVYAPAFGGVVLVGGVDALTPVYYSDVWVWSGVAWRRLRANTGDPACWGVHFNPVYDGARERLVLITDAGVTYSSQMWELRDVKMRLTQPLPRIGEKMQARFSGLPPGGVLVLGMSLGEAPGVVIGNSKHGPWPLRMPLADDPVFRASLGLGLLAVADQQGSATIPLQIPAMNELRGLRLFFGAVCISAAGMSVTNGEYADIR
ncbi:MAG: hypothetical protein H6832_02205 [Planctomycetes bacterium]|nr:hypothetical protein [Planctomycetota bacterium]